jgi:hypothetical protein
MMHIQANIQWVPGDLAPGIAKMSTHLCLVTTSRMTGGTAPFPTYTFIARRGTNPPFTDLRKCNSDTKHVYKIQIKCTENFTTVPTCSGVLNTPSSGEDTEHWTLTSTQAKQAQTVYECNNTKENPLEINTTCRDSGEVFYTFYLNFVYEFVKIHVVVLARTRNGQF